ncbi:MAG: hypothetical protein HY794_18225 [Desulfarculus sp.]|nr:hypothetical protein [Desulfarculus sp.]
MLTKEQILAVQDLPSETVDVPEWGGGVVVRGLAAAARVAWGGDAFETVDGQTRAKPDFQAQLLVLCLVDAQGNRLFSDDDVPSLADKSSLVVGRLYDVAVRLSGIGTKAIEDAVKNEKPGPSAFFCTGWRSGWARQWPSCCSPSAAPS